MTVALAVAIAAPPLARAEVARVPTPPPFWTGKPDAAGFRTLADDQLQAAKLALDQMLAVKGKRTIQNTLAYYNLALIQSDNASSSSSLMESVHPDSALRSVAEEMNQAASKFQSDLSVNRAVYDALSALDVKGADEATRYCVAKVLRDFRLAGVNKNAATRKKIAALREDLVRIGQDFEKNIREDSRTIQLDSAADLEGLPQDFIDAHRPGPDGRISVGIEYPDFFPIISYAKNGEVRRRLFHEFMNRAYPQNMAVLDSLIAKRYELARLLGFKTWAECVTRDKMIETDRKAGEFIERLRGLTLKRAGEEYAVYLKRKQEDDPKATLLNQWERRYYGELIRKRDYNFDSQEARAYFKFDDVKQGVLDVTSKMFGVTYQRVEGADVWDPSVELYEMRQNGNLIGRFFFDLHPRPNKYNHAANFPIYVGIDGVQIPEGALVCNFPGGKPDDPGLMEQTDVVTFFHEFGHLLHMMFGGHQPWEPISGFTVEWDFVEAPSQMLEEWSWNTGVLQTFAKHYQTGAPIPADLVERMRKADRFGRASRTADQTFFSALSLNYYNRPPKEVNTDRILVELYPKYSPYPRTADTHFQAGFGHLDGYSAIYYTYLWSLVIAKDMFSQFDKSNLLDPEAAARYRDTVLAPGGSKPAAKLVHEFLKRDYDFTAFDDWVAGKN